MDLSTLSYREMLIDLHFACSLYLSNFEEFDEMRLSSLVDAVRVELSRRKA